jgi:hypothetical protein
MTALGCRPKIRPGKANTMRRFVCALILGCVVLALPAAASAQMVGGPPGGLRPFSPVTGATPFASGMSAQQQQMAQMYMLYGMMGMGRGNVSTGVANPFVNGGFGMGSQPSFDSPQDYGPAYGQRGAGSNRDELRAQRAEKKRLAKANAAAAKAAKAKGKKNAAAEQ